MNKYKPPYTISSSILSLVARISESVGRMDGANTNDTVTPQLRRGNRIKSIHGTLALENNTLSVEQITAVFDGKAVVGHPREIQEVLNAFAVYDKIREFSISSEIDFLEAHQILTKTLVDEAGKYRCRGVGVLDGNRVVHMAPPAKRVPFLMADLFEWLKETDEHPLIVGALFHYELEFIHPFVDGNGRMGRLWQTLIIGSWKNYFYFLPVESLIKERQQEYYRILAATDKLGDITGFVEFILAVIADTLVEMLERDQVSDQVSDQVVSLVKIMNDKSASATELMARLNLAHRPSFRSRYLRVALVAGYIEMTIPDKPNSRSQKYRLTEKGRAVLKAEIKNDIGAFDRI